MRLAIATLLTLGNAVCGFVGIALLAIHDRDAIVPSCLLIFGAWLFDMIDGTVARRLGVDGPFGAILDSLCDVISFGVLPAAIVVSAGRMEISSVLAIGAGAIYASAAVLRLGRYTVKATASPDTGPRLWFDGLSSPAAAMCLGAAILASAPTWSVAILMLALASLMVSAIPYPDLVNFYVTRRLPWWSLIAPLAALIADWRIGLVIIVVLYICSGPATAAWREFSR